MSGRYFYQLVNYLDYVISFHFLEPEQMDPGIEQQRTMADENPVKSWSCEFLSVMCLLPYREKVQFNLCRFYISFFFHEYRRTLRAFHTQLLRTGKRKFVRSESLMVHSHLVFIRRELLHEPQSMQW